MVPFTPSAGVLEWVDGTLPLGDYLIGRSVKFQQVWSFSVASGVSGLHMLLSRSSNCSNRNGGAHGRYGLGDWSFLRCREHMANVSTIYFCTFYVIIIAFFFK